MTGNSGISSVESSQRILIVHRYYWPDKVPCAAIMRSVAAHFVTEGYSVDVLTSQPSYREILANLRPESENIDGAHIRRLKLPTETSRPLLRIFNALRLGLRILLFAIKKRYDVIIVTSIPPVLGGFFAALAARVTKSRFLYYCMDLHPEVGLVSGDFSNPVLFRFLQIIDNWNCRQANPVLVHSEDMRRTLRSRPHGELPKIEILNNFSIPSESSDQNRNLMNLDTTNNRLTMIYAGNIGRFQGLETVVDAMGRISSYENIELIIMGDGVTKQLLKERAREIGANVRFLDYQPVEVTKSAIRQADIGLVTLIPEMYKYAYPSKTMVYLEQGRPIIAAVEHESELARAMESQGYGFVVPVGDVDAMADLLIKLADDTSWKAQMNEAALNAYRMNFSLEVVLSKWSRILQAADTDEARG